MKNSLFAAVVLALFLFGFGLVISIGSSRNSASTSLSTEFKNPWHIEEPNVLNEYTHLPLFHFPIKRNGQVTITNNIPEILSDNPTIQITTKNTWMRVYINNQLVYSYLPPEAGPSIGPETWVHFVSLDNSTFKTGHPIRIELTNGSVQKMMQIPKVYIGSKSAQILGLLKQDFSAVYIIFSIASLSVLLLFAGVYERFSKSESRHLFWLGLLLGNIALYAATTGNYAFIQFMVERPTAIGIINFFATSLLVVTYSKFILSYLKLGFPQLVRLLLIGYATVFLIACGAMAMNAGIWLEWSQSILLIISFAVYIAVTLHAFQNRRGIKGKERATFISAGLLAIGEIAALSTIIFPVNQLLEMLGVVALVFACVATADLIHEGTRLQTDKATSKFSLEHRRYQIAFESTGDAVFEWNTTDGTVFWGPNYEDFFGSLQRGENFPESFIQFIEPPDSKSEFERLCQEVQKTKSSASALIKIENVHDKTKWANVTLNPVLDDDKQLVSVIGYFRDVSDQITLKKELEEEKNIREIGATVFQSIYEADLTSNTVKSNYAQRALGFAEEGSAVSYDEFVRLAAAKLIHQDYAVTYLEKFNRTKLTEDCLQGKTEFEFESRRRVNSLVYEWTRSHCRLYIDATTGHICLVSYLENISKEKQKEEELQRQLDRELTKRVADETLFDRIFDIDLTNNTIGGDDVTKSLKSIGVDCQVSYTEYVDLLCANFIHPEFINGFLQHFGLNQLRAAYEANTSTNEYECRSRLEGEDYVWVRILATLYPDKTTGALCATVYVLNIEEEKSKELELIDRSQRDAMTRLYNKQATRELVAHALGMRQLRNQLHAIYMVDVDDFKAINDNLGHSFGDAVLVEIASKLKELFRSSDIVGRVGGDEFLILMTDVGSINAVTEKAQLICEAFRQSYPSSTGDIIISASVGVCMIEHESSKSFDELFRRADAALYEAKRSGKNQYLVDTGSVLVDSASMILGDSEIDLRRHIFGDNISVHVLQILASNEQPEHAIALTMELLAKRFGFGRAYVCECDRVAPQCLSTFEWRSEDVPPRVLPASPFECQVLPHYPASFDNQGSLYIPNTNRDNSNAISVMAKQRGATAAFQTAIVHENLVVGFIGFERFDEDPRELTDQEADILKMASRLIASFVLKQKAVQRMSQSQESLLAILDNLPTYAYIIDGDTYELKFANRCAVEDIGEFTKGQKCHEVLFGRTAPCGNACPIREYVAQGEKPYTESPKHLFDAQDHEVLVSRVNWEGNENCFFVNRLNATLDIQKADG